MAAERLLSSQHIYWGKVVGLRLDTVELPSGRQALREVVEHGQCVAMVVRDAQGQVLLVRQFRQAAGRAMLEIPAGGVDPGEDIEACVRRELREETGYLPRKVTRLGGFFSSPGFCTEYLHLFLAEELEASPLTAEDTESIEVVSVPRAEIPRLIASGEICDAKSIAGLLLALSREEGQ